MNQALIKKKSESSWKRNLALLMTSQGISMLGSAVVSNVIMWYVTLQTVSGIAVTGVTITTFLPQALIILFGGVLADRYSSRRIVVLSDSFIAASTLFLMVMFLCGYGSIGLILLVNTLRSLGTGLQMPAVRSMLPQILPKEYLMKGNSINTGIWSIISIISPGIGGLVLNFLGMEYALLLDVITAVIGIALLMTIPFSKPSTADCPQNPCRDLMEGLKYLFHKKALRNCVIFYFLFQFLIVPASQLTPLLATIRLGENIWILSFIEITFSTGTLVMSLVMSYKEFKVRHFTLIGLSAIVFGATMGFLTFAQSSILFLILMLLMGFGSPLYYIPLVTHIQENTDEVFMGRVFSYVDLFATIASPFGMMLFGPLSNVAIWLPFIAPGIGMILLGLFAMFKNSKEESVSL